MKVQVEEISPIKKKLFIQTPHENYLKELDKAYQKISQKVNIKGFRKGKVPRGVLEKYYRQDAESESINHLIEHCYIDAIKDLKINPVGQPKVTDFKKEEGQDLSFTAELEIRPEVLVKDYKGLKLSKITVEVTEEDLKRELEYMQNVYAKVSPAEEGKKAELGDLSYIDFEGKLEGVAFEGGAAKGVELEIGKGRYLKDLEDGIIGMVKGEVKTYPVNFPEDYHASNLAGKQTEFTVTLQDLKTKTLPIIDDEFAKDLGDENLEQTKQKFKERIASFKEKNAKEKRYNETLDLVIAANPFEVPDSMVEKEIQAMLENTLQRLAQQGIDPQNSGINAEKYREQYWSEAIRRVKGFLVLEAIAKQETMSVSEEELKSKISEIAASYQQSPEAVENYYRQQHLLPMIEFQILEQKVLDLLLKEAVES